MFADCCVMLMNYVILGIFYFILYFEKSTDY